MALNDFGPKLTSDAKTAINVAFDAMSTFRAEMADSSEKVVRKLGDSARALGWPPAAIDGITQQIQGVSKMQIQMIDHIMDAWEAQVKSANPMTPMPSEFLTKLPQWPGAAGAWPSPDAFKDIATDPVKFWMQIGEQWQKNWVQAMSEWTKMTK